MASASLNSAATAVQDIDMVLDGIKTFSKPGYLQIPRDPFRSAACFYGPRSHERREFANFGSA